MLVLSKPWVSWEFPVPIVTITELEKKHAMWHCHGAMLVNVGATKRTMFMVDLRLFYRSFSVINSGRGSLALFWLISSEIDLYGVFLK